MEIYKGGPCVPKISTNAKFLLPRGTPRADLGFDELWTRCAFTLGFDEAHQGQTLGWSSLWRNETHQGRTMGLMSLWSNDTHQGRILGLTSLWRSETHQGWSLGLMSLWDSLRANLRFNEPLEKRDSPRANLGFDEPLELWPRYICLGFLSRLTKDGPWV